ncbi:MAG TPA: FG-GAP-like repeat-containing protein [Polyangia bacterium]|jgi:hypothetical protein
MAHTIRGSQRLALFLVLAVLGLAPACSDDNKRVVLSFESPTDGRAFCQKDDADPTTPDVIDIDVVVRATGINDGTQVVLANETAGTSVSQPLVGGRATFRVPLGSGNNHFTATTADGSAAALPPITVTANMGAPAVTIIKPADGANLSAADDVDHDLSNGFQVDVEVRADVEDGQDVELYVGAALQPKVQAASRRAVFTAVQLPSGAVVLTAKAASACGNVGQDAVALNVITGQPGCAIQGFTPAAVEAPLGTVLNIATDADSGTAGLQTSIGVQVAPEAGAKAGLRVEIWYNSVPQANATTDANGLAAIPLTLPEGQVDITAHCIDAARNTGISQVQRVFVDTIAPDCALAFDKASGLFNPGDDLDSDGTNGVQVHATLSSTASDVIAQDVTFTVGGTPIAGTKPKMAGNPPSAVGTVTIAAGDNTVGGAVTDVALNACSATKSATLVTAGCAVNFTNLTAGQVLNIASDSAAAAGLQHAVALEVDAKCAGQQLQLQSATAGGVVQATTQQAVPAGSGLVAVNFADFTICSGTCQTNITLTATVSDTAGNTTVKTVTVVGDNTPPPATVTVYQPGGTTCGGTLTPSADQDPAAGIQIDLSIAASLDRQSLVVDVTNAGTTTQFIASNAPISNIVRVTVGSGANEIVAHVVSKNGNEAASATCTITIQDILVTFVSPADGAALNVTSTTVTGTVSIAGATVALQVDGVAAGSTTAAGNNWSVANVPVAEGARTLKATATASGGRTGDATITVQIDTHPPDAVGTLLAASDGRSKVKLTFTQPADVGTGLQSYRIRYRIGSAVTDANFAAATPIGPAPAAPSAGGAGVPEQATATGLDVNTAYYFGVQATDHAGNASTVASAGPVTLAFQMATYAMPSIGNQQSLAWFGVSIASGSINGDAYPDLVVGMPQASFASATSTEGSVLVYLGTATGLHTTPDFVIRGYSGDMWVGTSVSVLDFDGDGTPDLAIGAPGVNGFGGAVYLCRGGTRFAAPAIPPTVIDVTTCDVAFTRASPAGNYFGWSIAAANFDGDSADDLVVGALGSTGFIGEAFVIYGVKPLPSATSVLIPDDTLGPTAAYKAWQTVYPGAAGTPEFGNLVVNLGRLEGSADTTDDIGIAGQSTDTAYVVYGRAKPTTSAITIAPNAAGVLTLTGTTSGVLGSGFAGIGDTDGDGHREIAVGAPGGSGSAGAVFLVNGGATGTLNVTTATVAQVPTIISGVGERLGYSIANPAALGLSGDLNGDGYVDLFVANELTPWKAYLFYGGPTGFGATVSTSTAAWHFTPATADAELSSLSLLPDLNADGLPDLAAGDWFGTTQTVTLLR